MCYMSYVRWHWHWGSTRTAKSTDELALLCICCSLFCMRSGPISASLRGRTCANWSSPGTQAVHQAHMRCRATPRCAALRAGPEPLCNSSRPCCQCLHLGRRAAPRGGGGGAGGAAPPPPPPPPMGAEGAARPDGKPRLPPTVQCSNLTPIFIGMHRSALLSPMKRVPGHTIPMVPMHLAPMAPMHLTEQIRALPTAMLTPPRAGRRDALDRGGDDPAAAGGKGAGAGGGAPGLGGGDRPDQAGG
jgi:hypothetical protein